MKKKIRVLYTISNFNTAGSGKVLYDLASGLNKEKYEVEIACGDNKGEFFEDIKALGLPIHIYETKTPIKPYFSLIFRILKISRFFKKHQFDLIHSWQWSSDWTEALAARLAGCKWLYTKKAMGFASKHWRIKSRLAHFIITINDDMRSYFPYKRAQKLIPLGLDTSFYKKQPDVLKSNEVFKIITVANLVPLKGVEVLINAMADLRGASIELDIVGDADNSYGTYLKEIVNKNKLSNCVNFLGKKTDIRPYLTRSDLFVIPTLDEGRREGMPMALVEAMSIGIPVLGSNISGIKYVLKDFDQLLFEASSTTELKEKIDEIMQLSVSEREALGARLRSYCRNNYSISKFLEAHENLYADLVN